MDNPRTEPQVGQINTEAETTVLSPGVLTTDRAIASALGICRATVWNMVKSGHLHPVKLTAKTTRFRTDEALKIMQEGIL